jgi:CPA1 family monovalent cation:H+ antiporter
MAEVELVLGLMVAVAALGIVARRLAIPYPIALVFGGLVIGLAIGLIPSHPNIALAPELVFLLFLPPLLYIASFFTSARDFRAQARPILRLAVGLVLATMLGVAAIVHALLPELGWPLAFALGAIVSPPDAVAATSILRQLRVPRDIITVLEGESLINDATGLVAYRIAVGAAVTGAFSLVQTGLQFVFVSVAGVIIGLAAGWLVGRLRKKLRDPPVEITISLLTPFAAYLPAEALGASGVLSTVVCGLYLGREAPRIMEADTRLQGRAVWETLVFLLNGLVFILIGLQLPRIIAQLQARPLMEVVTLAVVVSLTVVGIRFAWVFVTDLPRLIRDRDAWRQDVALSWAGMRGVVSLAAALALPLTTASGELLPDRDLIIFLTVCVILVTLVGQGLSLPWILRLVNLHADAAEAHEETYAREVATQAARQRIDALAEEWPSHLPLIDTLRTVFQHRASHIPEHEDGPDGHSLDVTSEAEQELIEHRAIRHAVIEAERDAILDLRDTGQISDDVLRRVERELDLEELRMEA